MRELHNGVMYETFYGARHTPSESIASQAHEVIQQGNERNQVSDSEISAAFSTSREFSEAISGEQLAAIIATINDEVVGVLTLRESDGVEFGIESDSRNVVREITCTVREEFENRGIAGTLFKVFRIAGVDPELNENGCSTVSVVVQMPQEDTIDENVKKRLNGKHFRNSGAKPGNEEVELWKRTFSQAPYIGGSIGMHDKTYRGAHED